MISVEFLNVPGERASAVIRFRPPTEAALDIIRSTPGRKYDYTERSWTIPPHRLTKVLEQFHQAGLAVEVEGRPWCPSPPAQPDQDDPLVGVLKELPESLVQPTALALSRVWDESDEWMLRLHQAITTYHESRPGDKVRRLRRRVTA